MRFVYRLIWIANMREIVREKLGCFWGKKNSPLLIKI